MIHIFQLNFHGALIYTLDAVFYYEWDSSDSFSLLVKIKIEHPSVLYVSLYLSDEIQSLISFNSLMKFNPWYPSTQLDSILLQFGISS